MEMDNSDNCQKSSIDFYALQFTAKNSNLREDNFLNNTLDQLNALDYKSFNNPDIFKKFSFILNQCFSLVSPNETFLVAKCCQLLLMLVGKRAVNLDKAFLETAVPWCLQALQKSADIALLDILQAIEAVICSGTDHLAELSVDILDVLEEKLENRTSLTCPDDVKVWRVHCMAALASPTFLHTTLRPRLVKILWEFISHQPNPDSDADAQVVTCVLGALERLCQSDPDWLSDNLGDILGAAFAFLHFGLPGYRHQAPTRLFPLPGAQWDAPSVPNIKSNTKKRQKKRVNNIGGRMDMGEELEDKCCYLSTPSYMSAPSGTVWLTSDSEVSDSEGGQTRRLKRNKARVRLAAINLLLYAAKLVNIREQFGYYSCLLGQQGLAYNIVSDPNTQMRAAAASTVGFMLGNAKSYFAQAQHSTVASFTPFACVLASLLDHLHQCVGVALSPPSPPLPCPLALLHCASCLVDVSPYQRLRPDLLPPLLAVALPLIRHNDVVVAVAALTLLGCSVCVQPPSDQLTSFLSASQPSFALPGFPISTDRSWVISASLYYFQSDNQKAQLIPERVEWWQVVAGLVRHHPALVNNHIDAILVPILKDMLNAPELVKLHATRAFQQIVTVLAASELDQERCCAVWCRALEAQLLGLAGAAPTQAAAVCDCLAVMSPSVYQQLTEKLQICCMTCVLCCARDDEPIVRAAAVQALASFLSFPALAQDEQFMCDSSDVVCGLINDSAPLVSAKAAWALGNLTDMLYKNQYGDEVIPPIQLIKTSMEAALGKVKVRANGVRALGNLLGLLKDEHLKKPSYKDIPINAAQILVKNASANVSMKVSWNACYALGSMLKNEAIHRASTSWQAVVLPSLCSLVKLSPNFKVRTNASAALYCVVARSSYGAHYLPAWVTVLEGLECALNTTDFKEVKHRDGLLEQLCLTLCHLASLVEPSDLASLLEVVVYHMDTMQQHLSRFLSTAVPERTEAVLRAAERIAILRDSLTSEAHLTNSQRDSLTILADVFTFGV